MRSGEPAKHKSTLRSTKPSNGFEEAKVDGLRPEAEAIRLSREAGSAGNQDFFVMLLGCRRDKTRYVQKATTSTGVIWHDLFVTLHAA